MIAEANAGNCPPALKNADEHIRPFEHAYQLASKQHKIHGMSDM